MSIFRKLSLFSKRDSKISRPPPAPIASLSEEEKIDNAGSNKQRFDLLMTSCLGSEIGKGTGDLITDIAYCKHLRKCWNYRIKCFNPPSASQFICKL